MFWKRRYIPVAKEKLATFAKFQKFERKKLAGIVCNRVFESLSFNILFQVIYIVLVPKYFFISVEIQKFALPPAKPCRVEFYSIFQQNGDMLAFCGKRHSWEIIQTRNRAENMALLNQTSDLKLNFQIISSQIVKSMKVCFSCARKTKHFLIFQTLQTVSEWTQIFNVRTAKYKHIVYCPDIQAQVSAFDGPGLEMPHFAAQCQKLF